MLIFRAAGFICSFNKFFLIPVCLFDFMSLGYANGKSIGKENLFIILNTLYKWLDQNREMPVTKGNSVRKPWEKGRPH